MESQKVKYFLETPNIIDKVSNFCWEVQLVNLEPKYEDRDHKIPYEITLNIKNRNNKFNVFKRIVLVEKCNQEKSAKYSEMDFFHKWAFVSRFYNESVIPLFGLKREIDFKLMKLDNNETIINTWFFRKCTINYDSTFHVEPHRELELEGVIILRMESFTMELI